MQPGNERHGRGSVLGVPAGRAGGYTAVGRGETPAAHKVVGGADAMSAEKICIICKEDCSARPRLKDSGGQYACQACVEAKKRQAAKSKARPAPAAVAPVADGGIGFSMDDYLGDAAPAAGTDLGSHCPNCGAGKAAGAVVCMQCGFDSASGKAMSTKVRKAKVQKDRKGPRVSGGAIFLLAIVGMLVLLPVLAMLSQEAAVGALLIAGLWGSVAYIMMVVAAFRDEDTFWGIIGILTIVPLIGFFCTLAFALYYCIFGSQRGSWKLNYWASFFAMVIVFAIMATSYPDLLSQAGPAATP